VSFSLTAPRVIQLSKSIQNGEFSHFLYSKCFQLV
jgi:hypothetical protein